MTDFITSFSIMNDILLAVVMILYLVYWCRSWGLRDLQKWYRMPKKWRFYNSYFMEAFCFFWISIFIGYTFIYTLYGLGSSTISSYVAEHGTDRGIYISAAIFFVLSFYFSLLLQSETRFWKRRFKRPEKKVPFLKTKLHEIPTGFTLRHYR